MSIVGVAGSVVESVNDAVAIPVEKLSASSCAAAEIV